MQKGGKDPPNQIEDKREFWIEIKESPIHGLGAFARRDIPAYTYITRYTGPIVDREQEEKLSEEQKKYLFAIDNDYSIDGR